MYLQCQYLLCWMLLLLSLPLQAQLSFSEAASSWGITHQSQTSSAGVMIAGSSVSACDFNGDGLDDITLGVGIADTIHFYLNTGNSFQKITPPVIRLDNTRQLLWVDYDNDGDKDLFIAHDYQANRLYQNDGNFNFTDVTSMAGLPIITDPTWSVAFGDYDRDGWLDLFVSNYLFGSPFSNQMSDYLFRNKGDGTFENVTISAGIPDYDHAPFAIVFADYDNDLWPDIFIASDKTFPNRLYHNEQDGQFTDVSAVAGVNQVIDGMGIAVGDYDDNGALDFYATGGPPVGNVMLRNQNTGIFQEVTQTTGTFFYDLAWGCNFMDFDNDTDLDLYVSGSSASSTYTSAALFENNNASFTQLDSDTIGMAADTVLSNAQAIGDFNNDGYPDIIVNNQDSFYSHLWINDGGNRNWLKVNLEGTASNRDGIGAFIEIYINGVKKIRYTHCGISFMAQNSRATFFGLDTITNVDSLNVHWPSGHIDHRYQIACNQSLHITEGSTAAVRPIILVRGPARACLGEASAALYANGRFNSYLWSTGETTASIRADLPGWYTLTTTDGQNRSMTSDSFWVDSLPGLQLSWSAGDLSCYGDSTAFIFTAASGGTGPLSYSWASGATGSNRYNLPAGNYSLQVTDSLGCLAEQTISIVQPPLVEIDTISNAPLCQGLSNGTLAIDGRGGLPPYQYSWSTGANTASISGLAAGSYTLTLSDANACERLFVLSLEDSIQLQLNTIILAAAAGQNMGQAEVQAQAGQPPYSYLWSDGQSTATATGLAVGTYMVSVTDAQGCEQVDTAAVPLFIGTNTPYKSIFKLFPNPSKGELFLQLQASSVQVKAVDVLGRRFPISIQSSADLHQLNISHLDAGVYFLFFYIEGTCIAQEKLILYTP